MIRRLSVEIKPFPLLPGEMDVDDDSRRMVGVRVITDVNSYGFTEVIPVNDWESFFDHVMRYATIKIKQMINEDEVKHVTKKITPDRG